MTSKPKVLIVPEGSNGDFTPCGWIRLIHPYSQLAQDGEIKVLIADWSMLDSYSPDLVVTQRMVGGTEATKLITVAQKAGAKVILDLDDYLLGLTAEHPDYLEYEDSRPVLMETLECADLVTVATEDLANVISAKKIITIPNELASQIWFNGKLLPTRKTTNIQVLFAGTISHAPDWKLIESQVLNWLDHNKNCNLFIVGVTDNGLPKHAQITRLVPPRAAIASYPAYVQWLKNQGPFDIGLAPLANNLFNGMKSDLKLLEYGALGAHSLASPVGPYLNTKLSSECFTLVDDDNWFQKLNETTKIVSESSGKNSSSEIVESNFSLRAGSRNQMQIKLAIDQVLT